MPIKLLSTDFDGTIFAEFESPPVPPGLQNLIAVLQRRGALWVINTGRDLGSLLETVERAELAIQPDALVLVEREIYVRKESRYVPLSSWNSACSKEHAELFARVKPHLPALMKELQEGHQATFYEDAFSPLCVLAGSPRTADAIQERLTAFAQADPHLAIVRNDVYIRFAHSAYNKGTALLEIARRLRVTAEETVAAGDHLNDLPMLDPQVARSLIAPSNAIALVQERVRAAGGYLSHRPHGEGVALGIEYFLERV